jgi:hypothetical protein
MSESSGQHGVRAKRRADACQALRHARIVRRQKKKAGKLPALKASAGRMPSLLLLLSCSANDQFAFHART